MSAVVPRLSGELSAIASRTACCMTRCSSTNRLSQLNHLRAARNATKTGNLVTLACHVATRLPRVWYFSSTDVELTTTAVILLRVFVTHLAGFVDGPSLRAMVEAPVNAPSTKNAEVEGFAWPQLVSSLLDFLATGKLSDATYELHTQAATLLLALLSTQLHHGDVLEARAVLASAGLVGPASDPKAVAAAVGGDSADPFLHAAMLVGGQPLGAGAVAPSAGAPPSSASFSSSSSSSTPSKPKPASSAAVTPAKPTTPSGETPQRAAAVVTALLRYISVDGGRSDDGPEPQGSDTNGPALASLGVQEARTKAVAEWTAAQNRPVKTGGSLAGKAADAISNSVLGAAKGIAGLPGALISGLVMTDKGDPVPRPLAERAALCLLLLTHNCRSGIEGGELPRSNPYRVALSTLTDPAPASVPAPLPAAIAAVPPSGRVSLPFKPLFKALCVLSEGPLGVALVYTLLQCSPELASNLLVRSDVDELLLPILSQLHRITMLGPDHRYILLITLLLFTQDSAWCTNAHRRIIIQQKATAGWYTGRPLGVISLGSLLVLLLTRVVTASPALPPAPSAAAAGSSGGSSSAVGSDSYLHTNCFAALANMAPHIEGMHPVAASKLVGCLATLHKRYRKTRDRLSGLKASSSGNEVDEAEVGRYAASLEHLDQCIRICSEVVLAATAPAVLSSNVHLLYALLATTGEGPASDAAATGGGSGVVAGLAADPAFSDCGAVTALYELTSHFGGVLRAAEEARLVEQMTPGSAGQAYTRLFSAPTAEEARQRLGKAEAAGGGAAATAAPAAASSSSASSTPSPADITPSVYGTKPSSTIVWGEGEVVALLIAAIRPAPGPAAPAPASPPAALPAGVTPWRGGAAATAQAQALLETKFTYEEDAHPELFFSPYLWALGTAMSGDIPWEAGCGAGGIKLYPQSVSVGQLAMCVTQDRISCINRVRCNGLTTFS